MPEFEVTSQNLCWEIKLNQKTYDCLAEFQTNYVTSLDYKICNSYEKIVQSIVLAGMYLIIIKVTSFFKKKFKQWSHN